MCFNRINSTKMQYHMFFLGGRMKGDLEMFCPILSMFSPINVLSNQKKHAVPLPFGTEGGTQGLCILSTRSFSVLHPQSYAIFKKLNLRRMESQLLFPADQPCLQPCRKSLWPNGPPQQTGRKRRESELRGVLVRPSSSLYKQEVLG
jgi:hypothetical protein